MSRVITGYIHVPYSIRRRVQLPSVQTPAVKPVLAPTVVLATNVDVPIAGEDEDNEPIVILEDPPVSAETPKRGRKVKASSTASTVATTPEPPMGIALPKDKPDSMMAEHATTGSYGTIQ
jgi:hypothetical protein